MLTPDPEPEQGHFYRSDHFSLAKVGVVAISPDKGSDLVVGGTAAGKAARDDYVLHHYHQPSDEFNPNWDVANILQDIQALRIMGDTLANNDVWPSWKPGSEFIAAHEKMMGH